MFLLCLLWTNKHTTVHRLLTDTVVWHSSMEFCDVAITPPGPRHCQQELFGIISSIDKLYSNGQIRTLIEVLNHMNRWTEEIGMLQLAILWSFIYTRLYTYLYYHTINKHKNHIFNCITTLELWMMMGMTIYLLLMMRTKRGRE